MNTKGKGHDDPSLGSMKLGCIDSESTPDGRVGVQVLTLSGSQCRDGILSLEQLAIVRLKKLFHLLSKTALVDGFKARDDRRHTRGQKRACQTMAASALRELGPGITGGEHHRFGPWELQARDLAREERPGIGGAIRRENQH